MNLKGVICGDPGSGKTSLLHCLDYDVRRGSLPQGLFDEILSQRKYRVRDNNGDASNMHVMLHMHDVGGDRHQDHMRRQIFLKADLVILCVAKDEKYSFANMHDWICEIDGGTHGKPIFLA